MSNFCILLYFGLNAFLDFSIIHNVLLNGAQEKGGFLAHQSYLLPVVMQVIFVNVVPVN